jgi:exopolysaccharide biosynthesis polyprenyl glycosylphosphotransferase
MDSRLEKSCKLFIDFIIAVAVAIIVPLFFSPSSETLVLVTMEKTVIYSLFFGLSCLLFGEVFGLREQNFQIGFAKSFFLPLTSAFLASLALLLLVWGVEYSFIGRFAFGKIFLVTALGSFLSNILINKFFSSHPTSCLLFLSSIRRNQIIEATKHSPHLFRWVDLDIIGKKESIQSVCKTEKIDLLVIDEENTEFDFDIVQMLSQGTQVLGLLDFWQKYIGCIPPSEVHQSWLTKLDLRMRNPLALKLKRTADVVLSLLALTITAPLLLIVFFLVVVESGFPLIFSQTRTGFLNQNFTIYKIRTMRNDAEKKGAIWASENDSRVTNIGKILRKLRIDEIPQFWNVIKGDMSIVGPRPERPEFQEELNQSVPYWNARHLVKPGITGWAQIKFKYASSMQTSEQKLAYDLYYLRNLSFALDFEIILGTLRSIGKGSR